MISAAQVREACALIGWTPPTLAKSAVVSFDAVAMAQDDMSIRCLGGLQLGAIQRALEAAGILFIAEDGEEPGVHLRKASPA